MNKAYMRTYHLLSNKVGFPRIQRPAYILSRSLWSSYTASHPNCFTSSTLSVRSPDICIAIVSNTFSHAELESIPKRLTTLLHPKLLIGCVVDKIHGNLPDGDGVSLLVGDLSLNKSVSISEFSYEIEGDRKLFKASNWVKKVEGKVEVEKDFFMFSDMEPHLLLRSLDHHFPAYKKLGIIGTSTPFTTARPVTLFYNEHVLSQGVVGFSLTPNSIGDIALQHDSLSSLGNVMKITKCRGNIILELDGLNATQLLLDYLRAENAVISKEADIYLGICPPSVHKCDVGFYLYNKPKSEPTKITKGHIQHSIEKSINLFLSVSDPEGNQNSTIKNPDKSKVTKSNTFGGVSENGIIIGQGGVEGIVGVQYTRFDDYN
ncbi:8848_t:CDS:2 [Paraglomus occultum]|uniref:8848_t:CDS:1 n=1 Tax=Paraglomus occultum TaxID=144539 RepID=A0A9N9DKF6_9GLOM|nr:8848_t:CDS:2 [Paraglomus occultum]